ncbi:MAG: hypothetical protein J6334_12390 [Kiritimatiellae bacterium]|nr:hypothetical protein [Kiritimatiellia bacterium]
MTHTFKIRYANVLVGALCLVVLVILICSTLFIGTRKHWFRHPFLIETELPYRRSLGLKQGTSVMLMDATIGEVTKINYFRDGKITAILTVNELFKPFIRTNAVGIVRKEFGVAGEQRIVITQSEEGPTYADFETLPPLQLKPDVDLVQTLLKTADKLSSELPALLDESRTTISNVMTITGQLADTEKGIQPLIGESTEMIKNIRLTLEKVHSGDGTVATVLNDPAFAENIRVITARVSETLETLNGTMAHVKTLAGDLAPVVSNANMTVTSVRTLIDQASPLVASVQKTTDRLPDLVGHVDEAVQEVPDVLRDLNQALMELEVLLRGLQEHWFLRGGVEKAKEKEGKALQDPSGAALVFP